MNPQHLLHHIIEPVLKYLNLYTDEAAMLLLGTAIQESRLKYLVQLGGGPGLGIYQCEPATHKDIFDNYLNYRKEMLWKVRGLASFKFWEEDKDRELVGNHFYSTAIARIHYLRVPSQIPSTLDGQAEYWKHYYNTIEGSGTEQQFIDNFQKMMT